MIKRIFTSRLTALLVSALVGYGYTPLSTARAAVETWLAGLKY